MAAASVIETHISVLLLAGDRVYKVRKPVTTAFLDFSTRQSRLEDCRREVALNRRLAPDVYLGVHDLVDESGHPVEHVVVMRRLPDARRLATLVADPGFDRADLVGVARVLAAFHERAERSPEIDRMGSAEHLRHLWTTNLDEMGRIPGLPVAVGERERLRAAGLAYLDGRQPLLAERVRRGRIVDGHGDLLAEDVFCLADGPRILDCLEFDAALRRGDVLYDTAFLAMDLERLGRPDLARAFLDAYREFTAQTHPASLEHWYVAYRALVRAKIAGLRAAAGDAGALGQARDLTDLAARHLNAATVRLVLVGGLPGSGKTTLAAGLAELEGWTLLRSDEIRKEQAGLGHDTDASAKPFAGIYTAAGTADTYDGLLHRASLALGLGESVVLDATWLDPDHRDAARAVAAAHHAELHELCCVLPLDLARSRLDSRRRRGGDASDATAEVLDALAARATVPWPGAAVVDTRGPAPDILVGARHLIGEAPER